MWNINLTVFHPSSIDIGCVKYKSDHIPSFLSTPWVLLLAHKEGLLGRTWSNHSSPQNQGGFSGQEEKRESESKCEGIGCDGSCSGCHDERRTQVTNAGLKMEEATWGEREVALGSWETLLTAKKELGTYVLKVQGDEFCQHLEWTYK